MPRIEIGLGDASEWEGARPHLVFTHPYAPFPDPVRGVPAIVNLFGDKHRRAEIWVGQTLRPIGCWGKGQRNTVYVTPGLDCTPFDLSDLREDNEGLPPGKGWFPLELPLRLLRRFASPGITVWDGFMGRGTVGRACRELNMNYIGLDIDPARVRVARDYLGVDS